MRAGLNACMPALKTPCPLLAMPAVRRRKWPSCVKQPTDCTGPCHHSPLAVLPFESLAVAIMRHLSFGVLLLGTAAATQSAEPEYGNAVPSLDLVTVRSVSLDTDGLARASRFRFTASIVPIHSVDTKPFGFGYSNASHLTPANESQRETVWAANSEWTRFLGNDRTSWSPRLRIESAGQRLEIVPRRHSVWIQWRKTLR